MSGKKSKKKKSKKEQIDEKKKLKIDAEISKLDSQFIIALDEVDTALGNYKDAQGDPSIWAIKRIREIKSRKGSVDEMIVDIPEFGSSQQVAVKEKIDEWILSAGPQYLPNDLIGSLKEIDETTYYRHHEKNLARCEALERRISRLRKNN